MKKNWKALALLMALVLMLGLVGCGSDKDKEKDQDDQKMEDTIDDQKDQDDQEEPKEDEKQDAEDPQKEPDVEEPQKEETPEQKPETPAQKPAEKPAAPAQKPAQKPAAPAQKPTAPTQKPAEKPAQKPAEKPAQKPAEKPAQKPEADKKVDLAAFSESVTANENWPSLMPTEGEALDSLYPGLSGISTKQKVVYTPMISAAAGELALVEVSNSSDVQKVKDIFQARISYQVGDEKNPGGAFYPGSIESWKNTAKVVSNGNYIMLAVGDGAASAVQSFQALFA